MNMHSSIKATASHTTIGVSSITDTDAAVAKSLERSVPQADESHGVACVTNGLPLHVATDDEPIPSLGERLWDGPDMAVAVPIEQMIEWLRQLDEDDVGYLALWRNLVASIGCSVLVCHERDGEVGLMHGSPCDTQIRHRSRWMYFLIKDLDRIETRRDLLMRQLVQAGPRCDKRPRNTRAVTSAIRDFIVAGGRLLLTPKGHLEDSVVFRDFSDVRADQHNRAFAAYDEVRRRFQSDHQIKRAVRMLGTPTENGWIVLERKER